MEWNTGIICAADTELEPFLPLLQRCVTTQRAMLKIYEGTISGMPVVILYSGVCKVNAAIAAQVLIDHYRVNAIINAGTAGGMDESVSLFDTVITSRSAYHDVSDDILTEFHPWLPSVYFDSDPYFLSVARRVAQKTKRPLHFGTSVTGEQFITDIQRGDINRKFSPLSVDMETASIAHVCHVNRIPFIAIRTITDTPKHSGLENFERNCRTASEISKEIVLLFLQELSSAAPHRQAD